MNFRFENDTKNNVMKLHISIPLRRKANERRIKMRWSHIEKIVKEHQNCMSRVDDFKSYIKYLRILESKVNKKEFTRRISFISNKIYFRHFLI